MSFYGNLQAKALSLLAKYGQDIVLRKVTQQAYDPATSQQATTTADTTYKGALFDFSEGITEFRGELIRTTDKRMLLDGAANPTVKDFVLIGGSKFVIASIGQLNPAGTNVIWDLHLTQ